MAGTANVPSTEEARVEEEAVTIKYDNGDVYMGPVNEEGLPHGDYGVMIYVGARQLLGTDGKSLTVCVHTDGSRYTTYEGPFVHGARHGRDGTLRYYWGSVYKGDWKHNKKNGVGTYTFAQVGERRPPRPTRGVWCDDVMVDTLGSDT